MKQLSFLARNTLGLPNYFLVAMATMFMLALAPLGAWKALQSNSNRLESWLPAKEGHVRDDAWFREQFDGDQFVLVSWDGCTLGKASKLQNLARQLSQVRGAAGPLFLQVTTGPEVLNQLTAAPYSLPSEAAVERLEGSLIGPLPAEARGKSTDAEFRTTCLAAVLSPPANGSEAAVLEALAQIRTIAAEQCGIDATLRMAGPPIDDMAIDAQAQQTLLRYGMLAATAGFVLAIWRLRSIKLAAMVTTAAVASAAMSLAIVYYAGVLEVVSFGRPTPLLGMADAITLAIPAIVYVISLSAAVRLVHHYRDARRQGMAGAAEQAVADGWPAWGTVALMFAATLGVLCLSELLPARRFGLFTGLGVIASVGAVLSILSVWLHRFPLDDRDLGAHSTARSDGSPPRWLGGLFEMGIAQYGFVLVCGWGSLAVAGWGLTKLQTSTRLPTLVAARTGLVEDNRWFSDHVGHAVAMEIVLTVPDERCRQPQQGAEEDGQQYRLTMLERMELMRLVEGRIEAIAEISGSLSPATFLPAADLNDENAATAVHETLKARELVRAERHAGSDEPTGRELWRVTARLAPSTPGEAQVNYEKFMDRLRAAVEPVLMAYEQRDWVVRNLHERSSQLQGAELVVLFRSPGDATAPTAATQESMLGELLRRSGVAADGVSYFNLAALDGSGPGADAYRERAAEMLKVRDGAILISAANDPAAAALAARGVNLINVATLPTLKESATQPSVEIGGPRPIRAVYTGLPAVATAASRELATTLRESFVVATPLVALAIMFAVWHPVVGLATMAAVLLPLAATVGVMGWLGVEVDLGILLIAGLAMGMALDGTIHYMAWFRRGAAAGLFRQEAARMAFCRCAPAMLDTTLIAGIGMLALSLSGITGVQQFGLATIGVLAATMAGSLVLLPAVAVSPLGRFLGVEAAPAARAPVVPVRISTAERRESEPKPSRKDAAASVPAAPHRSRPPVTAAEERAELSEGPHAALQAKLQRLRRTPGDSASS